MGGVLCASRKDEVNKRKGKIDCLVSLRQRSQATLRLQEMNVKDGVKIPSVKGLSQSRL